MVRVMVPIMSSGVAKGIWGRGASTLRAEHSTTTSLLPSIRVRVRGRGRGRGGVRVRVGIGIGVG